MNNNQRNRSSSSSSESWDSEEGWRPKRVDEEEAKTGGADEEGTEVDTDFTFYNAGALTHTRHQAAAPGTTTTVSEMNKASQLSKVQPLPRLQKLTPSQKASADLLWALHAVQEENARRANERVEKIAPENAPEWEEDEEMPELPGAMELMPNEGEEGDDETEPPKLSPIPKGESDEDQGMIYSDDDLYQDFGQQEAPKKKKAKLNMWSPGASIAPFLSDGDFVEDDSEIPQEILFPQATNNTITISKPIASKTPFFTERDYVEHDSQIPREILNTDDIPGPSGYTRRDARRATRMMELEEEYTMAEYWRKVAEKEEKKKMKKEKKDKDMDQD
ncbi:hypothetical protein CAEBREN_23126 [Caenorhabditis brenneri]|uniref:Uncharacterized protein n=1 Tax=Caenorhabditis brenneri TaxID=135651 RepID=G0MCN8_CAEBE|nr:hypothetical protein CAEBREN_23126 [Caenorhabditis brenneri]